MNIVLDTNLVVSGIFWKGVPGKILDCWVNKLFQLVITEEIFLEYRRVVELLSNKTKSRIPEEIVDSIAIHSILVKPYGVNFPHCEDPDDNKFIEAAAFANAKYLVTGDKALLKVERYKGGEIIQARHFLDKLGV
jgi:putative PIN family toxin of toxin-antitoxin system